MYKHVIAAVILMSAFISGPSVANAQQGVQDSTYNQAPANDSSGQTGGTTNDQGGFDWRWLLPLAVVPFLFFLKRDNREEDRSNYRDQRFAGSKGGEARRSQEDDAR